MKRLEHLLKKTTPYSPKEYCKIYGKRISDYVRIDLHYIWSNESKQKVLEDIFLKHPDAEIFSSFSKVPYDEKNSYYTGILLVPKTQTYRVHANGRKH